MRNSFDTFRFRKLIFLFVLYSVAGSASFSSFAQVPRLAKSEPPAGCYFSAFVGPDASIRQEFFRSGGNLEDALGRIVGKRIAVEFKYFNYDNPRELNAYLKGYATRGPALEVALEPTHGLQEVKDDELLQTHARNLAAHVRPVFLRFASEMNGSWTPYHNNPTLYKQKFRLVHDVMARIAPNVIMVWCVANEPHGSWDSYYPGDAYVDWVGVNFYSVLHHNNDVRQPADHESIASHLDRFYSKFAARKPIAICEYGASREEKLAPGVDLSDWAAAKMTALLTLLPAKYPRVKLVGLFNVNTMSAGFASNSEKANNYCFSSSRVMTAAMRKALANPHYLSFVPGPRPKGRLIK